MKEFETAKMDQGTRLLTVILLILMPLFAVTPFFIKPAQPVPAVALMIILIGAVVISYGFVPKSIEVSESRIIIKNLYGRVAINIKDIKTLEQITTLGFNFRTFGVGGLFGYFGYFNKGEVWYVTNRHKKVRITLQSGKIYMISPGDPEKFVATVTESRNFTG
ncbi:PH domain-containing protein [Kaistella palustris]|uniref:PH domain-containing protein n=1 Tax=Kaistella palustris TaxID=493376 RepID=UPI0003F70A42|nr:PH domain-containing protein [Kaistella palustris]